MWWIKFYKDFAFLPKSVEADLLKVNYFSFFLVYCIICAHVHLCLFSQINAFIFGLDFPEIIIINHSLVYTESHIKIFLFFYENGLSGFKRCV